MSVAWSWAFDTPFSWTKQIASHFGGTRQGMAISWPAVIKDKGGIRNQFTHLIDIVPTILEATKIKAPDAVDGIKQKPIEGASFMYTFDAANANAPSRHTTQYFEMMGDHAIYNDGWIASTKVMRPPWDIVGAVSQDPAAYPYELYDLTKDWTQSDNLAAKYPDKVKEMEFWTEAAKYQVEPLDATVATRVVAPRPSLSAGRNEFTWSGTITGTPNGDAPSLLDASYTFTADVDIPQGGAEGMIVTQGGRFGGYGFYLLKGKPVFLWNLVDLKRVRWEGPEALPPGKHTLQFDFKYDGLGIGTLAFNNLSGIGRGGTGVLKVDGREVARQTMDRSIPLILQWDENFDIGADTGTLDKLTLKIDRPKLSPADIQKLKEATRNNKAAE
jgi:arylsulfatase